MISDRYFLKDLQFDSEDDSKIVGKNYHKVKVDNQDVRIYYRPNVEDGNGFEFYAVEILGRYLDTTDDGEYFVQCLYKGIAYFDGIRHLYMGDEATENYGYNYYANLELHIEILKVLKDLEIEYCRDVEPKNIKAILKR
jgi:hypothetical protein